VKKRLRIIIPVAVIVFAVVVWNLFIKSNGDDDETILLSGNVDVTQVDLAFKIAGRLGRRLVGEGTTVTSGQRLAMLEDTDQQLEVQRAAAEASYASAILAELVAGSRPEEIRRAEAAVEQARFVLDELQSGSRSQEIAEAEADLKRAKANERTANSQLALARSDFERYQAVYADGGISQQTFDTYRTRLDSAKGAAAAATSQRQAASQRLSLRREGSRTERIRQARWALAQAEAEYALVQAGPRQETIDQARAKRDASQAALAVARQRLADTELTSPFEGVVLSTSAEPGSYLNPGGTVLTIGDIKHVWVRAFISETDLGRIRLEQEAVVTVDAYPQRSWKGRVSYISSAAEFTPRAVQTFKERTNLVYRIKIQLDNADGALKPGMPADAVVEAAP
jgi:HlyD family secretion protein